MTEQTFILVIFCLGTVFGAAIAFYCQRKLDEKRISHALDTIGIRRKEFLKLDGQVASLQRTVAINTNRLGHLEQHRRK